MNHTRTIQKISFLSSCFNSTDTDLCGKLCTLYWLHTLSGQNRIQLATACKGEEAERGDKLLYCYTLTRKNLEVKHHRETDSKHD